jgi:outer membrane biosynthesis protein TonB
VINTVEEIRGIGSELGASVNAGGTSAGSSDRYQILHVSDPSVTVGFDADILILGRNTSIDHVRNLRRIIAAYLTAAYGYSDADASSLAVFITVYNAVYRNNISYFSSKYKPAVINYLSAPSAGLALNYAEWPGNTQIVIPVSDPSGGLSAVDTSLISDTNVIESLQGEDDKGIDDRKQLVDIKEREAEAAQQKADTAQAEADKEKETQAVQETALAEKKQEAQDAAAVAEEAKKTAEDNPRDTVAAEKAAEAEKIAKEKESEAEKQEQITEDQTRKAQDAQTAADTAQDAADTKRDEAGQERIAIAADQGSLIKQGQDSLAQLAGVYGLRLLDNTGFLSSVVKVNSQNGQLLKESPVRVIRSRTLYPAADGLVAIAGQNTGNGAVKLVVLDFTDMEILRESSETVAENSVLAVDGAGNYYAVIRDANNWVLGKYDAQLQLKQKSAITVNDSTPIVFTAAGIIVTGHDGSAKLLKLADLTEIR